MSVISTRFLSLSFFILVMLVFADAQTPVPVRNEPHHKIVLENQYVRLIDVHIPKHDTTLPHIHAAPSVIVMLSNSTIGTQLLGGPPSISHVTAAQTSYAAYDEQPITHKVWNQGDSMFHVMDIELVRRDTSAGGCAALTGEGIQPQFDRKLVRTYRLSFQPFGNFDIPASTCAHLLIGVSGECIVNSQKIDYGGFYFSPAHSEIRIKGTPQGAECVLLELR